MIGIRHRFVCLAISILSLTVSSSIAQEEYLPELVRRIKPSVVCKKAADGLVVLFDRHTKQSEDVKQNKVVAHAQGLALSGL